MSVSKRFGSIWGIFNPFSNSVSNAPSGHTRTAHPPLVLHRNAGRRPVPKGRKLLKQIKKQRVYWCTGQVPDQQAACNGVRHASRPSKTQQHNKLSCRTIHHTKHLPKGVRRRRAGCGRGGARGVDPLFMFLLSTSTFPCFMLPQTSWPCRARSTHFGIFAGLTLTAHGQVYDLEPATTCISIPRPQLTEPQP